MIGFSTEIEDGARLEADLCVVGSGPAGLAVALGFDGTGRRVLVLESGSFELRHIAQELNVGSNVGRDYFGLANCRKRVLGGTTCCWTGLCRPLDADDFEERDWVPHSGWPFGLAELEPYYRAAEELLEVGGPPWGHPSWTEGAGAAARGAPWPLADPRVAANFFKLSPPTHFGEVYRSRLQRSADIEVVLGATVTRIGLNPGGGRVERLDIARTQGGGGFTVSARRYVIACGGIETPRLLLASNDVQPAGVGNGHDLVGRFFMEHPHTDGEGVILVSPAAPPPAFYDRLRLRRNEQPIQGCFALTGAARTEARLLNAAMVLLPFSGELGKLDRALWRTIADTDAPGVPLPAQPMVFTFGTPSEQAPNPESRVRLDTEKDRLGVPRPALDWRLTAQDVASAAKTHEILAEAFARSGFARVKLTLAEGPSFPEHMKGGNHHMGTARMHVDPKRGVVDADGRVHGVANLYLAGSAVFPTAGAANPTLTLVALALRQAENLKRELGS